MADEISLTRSATIAGTNSFTDSVASRITRADLGANEKFDNVIPVTTTEADITLTNITTPKFVILENVGSAGVIQYGPKSGGSMVEWGRLDLLEEDILCRLGSSVVIRVRMVSGTGSLRVRAWG
jgi:hypothetical protein